MELGRGVGDNFVLNGPSYLVIIYKSNHGSDRINIPMIKQIMAEPIFVTVDEDAWTSNGAIILLSGKKIGKMQY